ncbi:MAG: hypothetical protein VB949_04570, partial [Pseudomonadales bacterium]
MSDVTLEGPAWDLSQEYPAPDSAAVDTDIDALCVLLDAMAELNPELDGDDPVGVAQKLCRLSEQARSLLGDPLTFASCLLSVNSRDDSAQALQGRLQSYQKRFADLLAPLSQFVDLAEDAQIDRYLADPIVAP